MARSEVDLLAESRCQPSRCRSKVTAPHRTSPGATAKYHKVNTLAAQRGSIMPLPHLPTEVWLQILSHLPYHTLHLCLKPCSRRLRDLVNLLQPLLHGLTPEIWITILLYSSRTHNRLKKASRISKEIRYLITNSSSERIKRRMYSSTLSHIPIKGGSELRLHGFLRCCTMQVSGKIYCNTRQRNIQYLPATGSQAEEAYPALLENATYPPMREMTIEIREGKPVAVTNRDENGELRPLRVKDVLDGILRAYELIREMAGINPEAGRRAAFVQILKGWSNMNGATAMVGWVRVSSLLVHSAKAGGMKFYFEERERRDGWRDLRLGVVGEVETIDGVDFEDDRKIVVDAADLDVAKLTVEDSIMSDASEEGS